MITTFKNRCVLKTYVIILRPIFDTTYKGKNRLKYTCEIYIKNLSYSNKVGIVFAFYQRMRSKKTSWAGPFQEYVYRFAPLFMNWQAYLIQKGICSAKTHWTLVLMQINLSCYQLIVGSHRYIWVKNEIEDIYIKTPWETCGTLLSGRTVEILMFYNKSWFYKNIEIGMKKRRGGMCPILGVESKNLKSLGVYFISG